MIDLQELDRREKEVWTFKRDFRKLIAYRDLCEMWRYETKKLITEIKQLKGGKCEDERKG